MLEKVCNQVVIPRPLRYVEAGASTKKIVPVNTQEFRYLRFRAIGNMAKAGANGNWDGFPYEHFEDTREGYGYKSFINKRAHYEHNSRMGTAGSIGDLPDAFLNKYVYPEDLQGKKWADLLDPKLAATRLAILQRPDQRDGAIEVLMRIDTKLVSNAQVDPGVRQQLERLIRMVDTGQKLTCSMGTNVQHSVCSACGNEAKFSSDYCDHIVGSRKGGITIVAMNDVRDLLTAGKLRPEWLAHLLEGRDAREILEGSSNRGVAIRNAEINHVLSFFELSVVGTPAYPAAEQLEKLARKQSESSEEYLKRMRVELGEDAVGDLFSYLQKEGLVSSACHVN